MKENITRIERIKKLDEVCDVLKKEFIGLDKIIDEIKKSVLPWYATPEVIERPVIVSLWGMTGTGKTSVISRLVELLDLTPKTLFFDCGEENSEDKNLTDTIQKFLTADSESESVHMEEPRSFVMVFDEFQYARTINEHWEEIDKPSLRPIWSLIDSGKLHINKISNYEIGYCNDFIDDLSAFALEHPEIKLKDIIVNNPDDVKLILENLGLFYFDRGVPGITGPCGRYNYESYDLDEPDKKQDPYRPLKVIDDRLIRVIFRKLGKEEKLTPKKILEKFNCPTLGELSDVLKDYKTILNTPDLINCSKSLIFIVGNLDEAFKESNDLNPDMDADIFNTMTSSVTDSDIKNALKNRFKPEQIARFGNSLIKYPSLKRSDFNELIRREIDRVCNKFKEEEKKSINIILDKSIYDLIYFEGVYPTQGVRPVFTTINTIFTPLLSNIAIKFETIKEGTAELFVKDSELGFKKEDITICIEYSDKTTESIPIKLSLGKERDPKNRKTAFICSVHEAGHAIVWTYLTGKAPVSIVSVSTDNGGFCTTFDKEKFNEIDSKRDIKNEVMISLAGYEAEQMIFSKDRDRTLLGSGSDIANCWEKFSSAAYELGYFDPFRYTDKITEVTSSGGPAYGFSDLEIQQKIKDEFEDLRTETKKILKNNRELLIKTALELGEAGELSEENFELLIYKHGGTLNPDKMKEARKENSYTWYKEYLESL